MNESHNFLANIVMLKMQHLLALLLPFSILAQTSFPEWKWALLHPIAAIQTQKVVKQCQAHLTSYPVKLDELHAGGQADAFRHLFYMAAIAQKIGIKKARKLGLAHEKGNYRAWKKGRFEDGNFADSLACIMDLRNNDTAFKLIKPNQRMYLMHLSQLMINTIKNGQCWILKFDTLRRRVDCNGEVIPPPNRKQWNIGGCLIRSS